SGVRPLYDDDHASNASAVTRDYAFDLDTGGKAPALTVFGGKITTYRRLAEHALEKLAPFLPGAGGKWTAGAKLPGGDLPGDDPAAFAGELLHDYPFLEAGLAQRLTRSYGSEARRMLGEARTLEGLGRQFGAGLSE